MFVFTIASTLSDIKKNLHWHLFLKSTTFTLCRLNCDIFTYTCTCFSDYSDCCWEDVTTTLFQYDTIFICRLVTQLSSYFRFSFNFHMFQHGQRVTWPEMATNNWRNIQSSQIQSSKRHTNLPYNIKGHKQMTQKETNGNQQNDCNN